MSSLNAIVRGTFLTAPIPYAAARNWGFAGAAGAAGVASRDTVAGAALSTIVGTTDGAVGFCCCVATCAAAGAKRRDRIHQQNICTKCCSCNLLASCNQHINNKPSRTTALRGQLKPNKHVESQAIAIYYYCLLLLHVFTDSQPDSQHGTPVAYAHHYNSHCSPTPVH